MSKEKNKLHQICDLDSKSLNLIHIIGIVGVPGNYGGFETLTDHLLDSVVFQRHGVIVYCEKDVVKASNGIYKGATLKPVRWRANGWQSVLHDTFGLWGASIKGGVILVLGTSATFWLPILRFLFKRNRYIVNMAGLEWSRSKWGPLAKQLLKSNEAIAALYAHRFIADNQGLVDYVLKTYGRKAELIAYGGDQFTEVLADHSVFEDCVLPSVYDFAMARAQIDNNLEMIIQAYIREGSSLVFVSNWDSTEYGRAIRERYRDITNIHLIGPVYEIAKVKALHSRVRLYVHGHSAGGTNPVLVEAMWAGLPTAAFDVNFNRYTTRDQAMYFRSSETLVNLLRLLSPQSLRECRNALQRIALTNYRWESIRSDYEKIILDGPEQ
jgi:glycosyltransferase involved in cell wall biosynthesis